MRKLLPLLLLFIFVNVYGYVVTSLPYNISSNGVYWVNTSLYCNTSYCFYVNNSSVTNITIISNGSGKIYINNSSKFIYDYVNLTNVTYNNSTGLYNFQYNLNVSNLYIQINSTTSDIIYSGVLVGINYTILYIYTPENFLANVYLYNDSLVSTNSTIAYLELYNIGPPGGGGPGKIYISHSYFNKVGLYGRVTSNGGLSYYINYTYFNNSAIIGEFFYGDSRYINNSYFNNSVLFLYFYPLTKIYLFNITYLNLNVTKYIKQYGMFNDTMNGGYIFINIYQPDIEVIVNNLYNTFKGISSVTLNPNIKFIGIKDCNFTNASINVYGPTEFDHVNSILQYYNSSLSTVVQNLLSGVNTINITNLKFNYTYPFGNATIDFPLIAYSYIYNNDTVNFFGNSGIYVHIVLINKSYTYNNTTVLYFGKGYSFINNSWMPINLTNATVFVTSNLSSVYSYNYLNSVVLFGLSNNSKIILFGGNKTYGIIPYINLFNSKNTTIFVNDSTLTKTYLNSQCIRMNNDIIEFTFIPSPSLNISNMSLINSDFLIVNNLYTDISIFLLNIYPSPKTIINFKLFNQSGTLFNIKNSNLSFSFYIYPYNNTTLNLTILRTNNSTIGIENTTVFYTFYYYIYNTTNVTTAYNNTTINLYGFNSSYSKVNAFGLDVIKRAWMITVGVNISAYTQYLQFLFDLNGLSYIFNLDNSIANISCSRLCDANSSVIGNSKYYLWYSLYQNINTSQVINWPDGNKQCQPDIVNGQYVPVQYPLVCFPVNKTVTKKKKKKISNVIYIKHNVDVFVPNLSFKILLLFLIFFIAIVLIVLGYLTEKK